MPKTKGQLAKEKEIEAMVDSFKLIPSAKPPVFHEFAVRSFIGTLWSKQLRPYMLENFNRTCSTCGWKPITKLEERRLHLHEIEEYNFQNMTVRLVGLELICQKCHAFHHILRTDSLVSRNIITDEQWKDLQIHFTEVNKCDVSIVFENWDLILTKSLQRNKALMEGQKIAATKLGLTSNPLPLSELPKTEERSFIVSDNVPFSGEIREKLYKKGLLYRGF